MPKILIIGAGIVGCSLADELTERGYCDVVVIEKGKLWNPGGSTSLRLALFSRPRSHAMAQFARQTVEKLWPSPMATPVSQSGQPGDWQRLNAWPTFTVERTGHVRRN